MKRHRVQLIAAFLFMIAAASCRKNELDDYYGRPDWLANPIYKQLESRANFNNYLALVEKSGYKDILGKAGYWTVFAPNDEAFKRYFTAKGISDVTAIDSANAARIVEYSMTYNSFKSDRLDDYQSGSGWVEDEAFRRRTAYYDFVYTENLNGTDTKLVASNRNGSDYSSGDNNNKYITYFLQPYFDEKKLTAADYTYFYPNATFTGFNVANAEVVNKDIIAENGVIHEVSEVIEPPQSIDQYIASRGNYSEFKKLLDKYMVSYSQNEDVTERYQALTGKSDKVYVKQYSSTLAFSPNNENYKKLQDNDGQSDSWSAFIPENNVLTAYINNVLLENYQNKSIDSLSINIITDFLNAHLWQSAVWPSKFTSTLNYLNEEARFDPDKDIIEKKVLSNGFFYGTSKVQEANVFHSVYGKAYLNPKYSLMTRALDLEQKLSISNPNLTYLLFLISDAEFKKAGFDWNVNNATFQYTPAGGTTVIGGDAVNRIKRLINTHVVPVSKSELNDLSGEGILETSGGEYIRYKNKQVFSAGTLENSDVSKQTLSIADQKSTTNGNVYYTNGILSYTEKGVGKHIEALATKSTDPFYSFFQFLSNSNLYNKTTGEINGMETGAFYTILIPTNAAIQDAVNKGWLPGTGTGTVKTPNYTSTDGGDMEKVARFIKYHIIDKNTIVPDGKKEGSYKTLFRNANDEAVSVTITSKVAGNMKVTDILSQTAGSGVSTNASVVVANSNVLSNRTVIHQIDDFLKYKY